MLDDIGRGHLEIRHSLYARNALDLMRDAILDAEGIASLVTSAARRRAELESAQVKEMTFHGPLHDEYHDASRQLRAAVGAGIAQTKRVLNQTADVIDAVVAHGTGLRSKSFGSQIASVRSVPDRDFGPRTNQIVALLRTRGESLDRSTHFRDKFLEHVHPLRNEEQPRPASGLTSLGFKDGSGDVMTIEDVVESDFNWVKFAPRKGGRRREYVIAHVVVAGSQPGIAEVVRLDYEGLTGHFRSTDPHRHIFSMAGSGRPRTPTEEAVIAESDLAHLQRDAIRYVGELLTICEKSPLV
jgi:hypothetical protein